MPNPGGYRSYLWTFEKEEDLPQIVELMRPLRVAGVFGHVSQLRHSLVDIACLGDKEYYFRELSRLALVKAFPDLGKSHFIQRARRITSPRRSSFTSLRLASSSKDTGTTTARW